MVLEEQKINGWPGLYVETTKICKTIGIPNVNTNISSKQMIKDAIFRHHYQEMKVEISKSKKMEKIKNEDFSKIQPYMMVKSIQQARMSFRIRCELVENIKGNFKTKYLRLPTENQEKDKLACIYCDFNEVETQTHCMKCPKWENLRTGLDMEKIEDVAKFFTCMLIERAKEDDKLRKTMA